MKFKMIKSLPLLLIAFVMAACGNNLEDDLSKYEQDTEELTQLNNNFNQQSEEMDFEKLEKMYYQEEEVDLQYLQDLISQVDKELVPLADDIGREAESITVENEDIKEAHNIILEDVKVKQDFTRQISSFLNGYMLSLEANDQLVSLSQSFITHQEERGKIIESAQTDEEISEMNNLIDVLNANSEELEEHSTTFHSEKSIEEKEQYVEETLLPLLDDHIDRINALNLSTSKATRARSISLEMYYNYQNYFEERKSVMVSAEQLQETALDNVLSLVDTARTLDENYEKELESLKNEAH
jgi:outer membrane PBP1 activator LpoA protein